MRISLPCLLLGMALGAPLSAAGQTEAEAPAGAADAATDPLEKIRAGIAAAFTDGDPVPAEVRKKLAGFSKRAADQTASPEQAAPNQQDVRKLTAVIDEIDGIQKGPAMGNRIKRVCGALQLETLPCSQAANLYAMRWQSGRANLTQEEIKTESDRRAEHEKKSRERSGTKIQKRLKDLRFDAKESAGGKDVAHNAASISGKEGFVGSLKNTVGPQTVRNGVVPPMNTAGAPAQADGDENFKRWGESYFSDPRKSEAARKVMETAERKVADPNYTNSTYGTLYKLAPHRAQVTMAANEIMMSYRYGGSEKQFPKDFGVDLKPGEVAELDHFFAGGVYGTIPVLGPMVCSGVSVVYDGIVSPGQKKFKNYSYDLKQVGQDMKGCSFGLTMFLPGK